MTTLKMQSNISVTFLATVVLLLCQFLSISAVDLEGAKESACFEVKKTVPVDSNWLMSQKTWYYPMMSRLDLYLTGVELSEKSAESLQEDELYYDSCMTFGIDGGKFFGSGFSGVSKGFQPKPIKGFEVYGLHTNEGENIGTFYTTLTDNKSFIFTAGCMADGNQMTWGVISTEKSLTKDKIKLIHDHAESLGFKREYFTGLRYHHCDPKNKQGKKHEL